MALIQNSLARVVTRTPRRHHITPVLKSLHWLKNPRAHSLQSPVPNLQFHAVFPAHIPSRTLHHPANTLYSIITLSHPFSTPVTSPLMFTNGAISITAPRLWNDLPPELRTIS